MPGRTLPRDQATEARGFADSFALRLRHHDEAVHRRAMPAEPAARACYEAIERVRYEALGENNYTGMRGNLASATELRTASDPIARATGAEEVPIQSALALMLREQLTGQPIPLAARNGVELVREHIESRIGDDFERLALTLDDQKAFQSLAIDMLRHLQLVEAEPLDDKGDDDESDEDAGKEDEGTEEDEDGGQELRQEQVAGESGEGEGDEETEESVERETEMAEGEPGDEGEEGMMPIRANRPWTDLPETFDYKVFTEEFDEVIEATELCDYEELERLRAYLDSQLTGLQGRRDAPLPTGCNAG